MPRSERTPSTANVSYTKGVLSESTNTIPKNQVAKRKLPEPLSENKIVSEGSRAPDGHTEKTSSIQRTASTRAAKGSDRIRLCFEKYNEVPEITVEVHGDTTFDHIKRYWARKTGFKDQGSGVVHVRNGKILQATDTPAQCGMSDNCRIVTTTQIAFETQTTQRPIVKVETDDSIILLDQRTRNANEVIELKIDILYTGEVHFCKVRPHTSMRAIERWVSDRTGICIGSHKMIFDDARVMPDDTVGKLDMEDQDTVLIMREQIGGKPVIYLFAPTQTQARLTLSLISEWSFSAIYPVVPITKGKFQQVEWDVVTQSDGSLKEITTGREVSYLYWEAEVPIHSSHRPPTPTEDDSTGLDRGFSPASCNVCGEDSILLEVATMTVYLDDALKAMGLHTEARTSFITYWLPSFLRHEWVALRFISQSSYEKAAPMDIKPKPDVVSRIFMIFKGVAKADVDNEDWDRARQRADMTAAYWVDVVGIDAERTRDQTLFRAIEWGGMEVVH